MDVGVERSNRFAKWEMLNEQKSSIERKLKQAEMNAVMKNLSLNIIEQHLNQSELF